MHQYVPESTSNMDHISQTSFSVDCRRLHSAAMLVTAIAAAKLLAPSNFLVAADQRHEDCFTTDPNGRKWPCSRRYDRAQERTAFWCPIENRLSAQMDIYCDDDDVYNMGYLLGPGDTEEMIYYSVFNPAPMPGDKTLHRTSPNVTCSWSWNEQCGPRRGRAGRTAATASAGSCSRVTGRWSSSRGLGGGYSATSPSRTAVKTWVVMAVGCRLASGARTLSTTTGTTGPSGSYSFQMTTPSEYMFRRCIKTVRACPRIVSTNKTPFGGFSKALYLFQLRASLTELR
jgi:hypothetical protein